MRPRVDLVTLGVEDLTAARRFYVDGLGWKAIQEVPGEIVFIQVGHGIMLALFAAEELAADVGKQSPAKATHAVTLAHNVDTQAQVIEVFNTAVEAGATVIKEPQKADFGGFHAYFADPAGFCWEVAHNPGWSVDEDGNVTLNPARS